MIVKSGIADAFHLPQIVGSVQGPNIPGYFFETENLHTKGCFLKTLNVRATGQQLIGWEILIYSYN